MGGDTSESGVSNQETSPSTLEIMDDHGTEELNGTSEHFRHEQVEYEDIGCNLSEEEDSISSNDSVSFDEFCRTFKKETPLDEIIRERCDEDNFSNNSSREYPYPLQSKTYKDDVFSGDEVQNMRRTKTPPLKKLCLEKAREWKLEGKDCLQSTAEPETCKVTRTTVRSPNV